MRLSLRRMSHVSVYNYFSYDYKSEQECPLASKKRDLQQSCLHPKKESSESTPSSASATETAATTWTSSSTATTRTKNECDVR